MNPFEPRKASADPDHAPSGHPDVRARRVGVLLVNLGTPEAASAGAVRRYLAEFLSDPRVVDYPRALWLPLLHGVILNVRPARTARTYAGIWRREDDESPLRYFTRAQAHGLAQRLDGVVVDWAMRYGVPSMRSRIDALIEKGCERILIVPLYPQYSATTSGSVCDAAFDALKAMRWMPTVRIAPPFHDDDSYIAALAATARRHLAGLNEAPELMLLSFHGLPQRYFDAGDPYYCHCAKTARMLRERMGWSEAFAPMTFQSKFGPGKWLEPATQATLERLARGGVKRVAVMTPGFVADCIETLDEIAILAAEAFRAAGGSELTAVPCINDAPEAISMLETIARRELSGWTAQTV